MATYRVVFHIDQCSKSKGNLVINDIKNLLADLGEENCKIELVANDQGVRTLLKTPNIHGEWVAALTARGVRFVACRNSLEALGLSEENLLDAVEVVPAGVGELVRKQTAGWAYIRP